jgi:hypothetical protein
MSSHNLVSVTYKESDHPLIFLPIDIPEMEGKPLRQKNMHFSKKIQFASSSIACTCVGLKNSDCHRQSKKESYRTSAKEEFEQETIIRRHTKIHLTFPRGS